MNFIHFILLLAVQVPANQSLELKASMLVGARSARLQQTIPIINQVVLVPDEQSYLDEISKWSNKGRWPVLFDKEPTASQFIRKFQPEKIWRRSSSGKPGGNVKDRLIKTVANAWGGNNSIIDALKGVNLAPLGVVFTSEKDPARTAAVALAAAYGQPILFLENDWEDLGPILSESNSYKLVEQINHQLEQSKLPYSKLGDMIDVLTICMSLPPRANIATEPIGPVAISDVIGRHVDGKRFAWTGWIFGSKTDAAFMAMSSLFLKRNQYWFCNTYPETGQWQHYGLGNSQQILPEYGIQSTAIGQTLRALRESETSGLSADLIYMNSKGNADFFDLSDARSSPANIPILNTPTALMFIHSWSLKNPAEKFSVGGTWLTRGVYAYVGSSHEPMLSAFVPPTEMLRRTMSLMPFLIAARWQEGESAYAKTWRINTIGDPLMLCPPSNILTQQFLNPVERIYYSDVLSEMKEAMKMANTKGSDQNFANAIAIGNTIGRDDLVISLWQIADENSVAGSMSAREALPALFRSAKVPMFISAYRLLPKPNRIEQDMLWQLTALNHSPPLQLLVDNIRPLFACDDIASIAQRLIKERGRDIVLKLIIEAEQHAKSRNARELQRMRQQYGR